MIRATEAFFMKIIVASIGAACGYVIGYLFYKHLIPGVLFAIAGGIAAIPLLIKYIGERRNRELISQFRQFLYALSTSLAAGRSVENALTAAEQDLLSLYSNRHSGMVRELITINGKVANGWTIERAFTEFCERTALPDIQHFNEVFLISKRSGGDMVELIRKTANLIAEKIEIEQEIQVMTAQKNFEAKAMAVIPFALIGFMTIGSSEYMAPLFEGIGRLIMTVVLLLLGLCYMWIRSIMRFEV